MTQQRAREPQAIDGVDTPRSPRLPCPPTNPQVNGSPHDLAKTAVAAPPTGVMETE
jgi:hypothetical protein